MTAARGVRVGAIASATARGALALALAPLEAALARSAPETGLPPVFVVGPPRSGTTLLSQVLVRCYRFAIFTNLAHRLHRTPLAAAWLARGLVGRQGSAFDSRFGHVAGWGAPSEGGRIWNRWVPEFGPLDERGAGRLPMATIRRTVFGTARLLGGPFLNKNVMHSVHMRLLDALFPGCVFLEIRRDIRDNARSIVRARAAGGGPTDAEGWWSVRPVGAEAFVGAAPIVQAAAQIRLVRDTIERDARHLGEGRRIVIDYAELCGDPTAVCARVERFCATRGVELVAIAAPPAPFPLHGTQALDALSERSLEAAVAGAAP